MQAIKLTYSLLKRILNLSVYSYNKAIFKLNRVTISNKTIRNINGKIFIKNKGTIIIEDDVRINSRYRNNPIGGNGFTSIVVENDAQLIIKSGVGISNSAIFAKRKILIEENVFIGGDCKIYDTDFHSINLDKRISKYDDDIKSAEVIIEKGAFIGAGTTILKGVTIGSCSVIGAGSVVSKSIPPNEIWAGNPIRFIRKI